MEKTYTQDPVQQMLSCIFKAAGQVQNRSAFFLQKARRFMPGPRVRVSTEAALALALAAHDHAETDQDRQAAQEKLEEIFSVTPLPPPEIIIRAGLKSRSLAAEL